MRSWVELRIGRATPWLVAVGAAAFGCALRYPALGYITPDATDFLLPWYAYVQVHGLSALGDAFTNYTPAYSYLLLLATLGDGLAAPLTLIKAISLPFEFGCAVAAASIVCAVGGRRFSAAAAFAAVWLAPSVLHNGALWGQAEAIWTFLVLLAVLAFLRDKPGFGAIAFGAAVSVKLQAVFLGPLVLGLVLRRRLHPFWLGAIPLAYLTLAVPTLLEGRPLADVLTIFFGQAGMYRALSMHAANLYVFIPNSLYEPVTLAGLALAAAFGLVFAVWIGRARRLPAEAMLIAACVTLLAMPFLLPKMHERYLYGFEVAVLILACLRPEFWRMALLAQVDSALAYMPFDGFGVLGLPIAALTNTVTLVTLLSCLRRATGPEADFSVPLARFSLVVSALWLAYAVHLGLFMAAGLGIEQDASWPITFGELSHAAAFAGLFVIALVLAVRDGGTEATKRAATPEAAAEAV